MSNHTNRSRRQRGQIGHRPDAAQVIDARLKLNLTQQELADRLDMSRRTLQEIEAGTRGGVPVRMDAARWELLRRIVDEFPTLLWESYCQEVRRYTA